MTFEALVRELILSVIRVIGFAVIFIVARPTIRRRAGKLTADVTLGAAHADVRAGQREVGEIVVKLGRLPGGSRVALRTIVGEVSGCVVGIVGFVVLLLVT